MKQSERVKALMEGFMGDRRAGMPILAIADKYSLNVCTVYAYLEAIALKEGTTRDALLYQPHSKFTKTAETGRKVNRVDPDEVRTDFKELFEKIDAIMAKMNEAMEED